MGTVCDPCTNNKKDVSSADNGNDGFKPNRETHVRVPSMEDVPSVRDVNQLLMNNDISNLNIDAKHCRVPTMGDDVDNLILANPFLPEPNSSDKNEIEIGMIVHVEIDKISKYGIQCTLPSYGIKGFISKENLSEELNKKLNHYGKDGDVKYMIRSHLKNIQSLQAKVLTYNETNSIVTLSCLPLNPHDGNDKDA